MADVIVIGAGPAGVFAAGRAAGLALQPLHDAVGLIERLRDDLVVRVPAALLRAHAPARYAGPRSTG